LTVLPNDDIVSGDQDGIIKVWNSTTGIVRWDFARIGNLLPINSLLPLPNNRIVSGHDDGIIRVRDLVTGTIEMTLNGLLMFMYWQSSRTMTF
jgi:WD40 repeat protein